MTALGRIALDGEEVPVPADGDDWRLAWHPPPSPPPGQPHGANAFCVTADGEVVLISSDGQRWGWPGGRPEPGESWEQTLRREIMEEACATVTRLFPNRTEELTMIQDEADVVTKLSPHPVADTVSRLTSMISAKGIGLFAVIDQSAEARQAGLMLGQANTDAINRASRYSYGEAASELAGEGPTANLYQAPL